jgi:RNA polymerase sigma-70 factor (ECF subfamily)
MSIDTTTATDAQPGAAGQFADAHPSTAPGQPGQAGQSGCCPPVEQQTCCDASAKAECCGADTNQGSAEDILQDVMLRIHRHAAELTEVSAVSGWIHEIARNAIIDHYRRAVVRREQPVGAGVELERPQPAEPEPVPAEARAELAACLEPLLAQLPTIYREALQLTDLDGLTQAAAAARVGLTTSGMKARVQRGRGQLKALLTDCCEIALDRRGGVIDYRPQSDDCSCRASSAPARTTVG